MSTHNICFCREIRKIGILFGGKKRLIKSYAGTQGSRVFPFREDLFSDRASCAYKKAL